MKKRLILIALVIMLSITTVMQNEIKAEAAGTVTAVGVAKAVLVLLAIAGVGIASGYAWDNSEEIKETVVSGFTTWLQNHDPEFYTAFMLAGTNIVAGRVINTYDALFFAKLKQYTLEYFGTDVQTSTEVGTSSFPISELQFISNGAQYITEAGSTTAWSRNLGISFIGFSFAVTGINERYVVFLNVDKNATDFAIPFDGGTATSSVQINGNTRYTRAYRVLSSNVTFFDTGLTASSIYSITSVVQAIVNNYIAGRYNKVSSVVKMAPLTTVGGVAATSVDATVVGAGQTITEDEDNEIVIDGDRTINLSNVNIDEWLKSLAEGTQTYAQAMQAIGLAAVNTQTQTLEEVQAIAQALNPVAAGTGTITGNYTVSLTDLFPFCIPFDLYNIIACFKADPVAPSAEITIPVGYDGSNFTWETYTVSLSDFDPVAAVVRVLEYIAFVIGLMLVTRKLIEG